jgi:hypothetical protein
MSENAGNHLDEYGEGQRRSPRTPSQSSGLVQKSLPKRGMTLSESCLVFVLSSHADWTADNPQKEVLSNQGYILIQLLIRVG